MRLIAALIWALLLMLLTAPGVSGAIDVCGDGMFCATAELDLSQITDTRDWHLRCAVSVMSHCTYKE